MTTQFLGDAVRNYGVSTADDELIFTCSGDMSKFDTHMLQCSAGAADVEVTVDGETWTSAYATQAMNATDLTPVLVTTGTGVFGFRGHFMGVRVRQAGATGTTASLISSTMTR